MSPDSVAGVVGQFSIGKSKKQEGLTYAFQNGTL